MLENFLERLHDLWLEALGDGQICPPTAGWIEISTLPSTMGTFEESWYTVWKRDQAPPSEALVVDVWQATNARSAAEMS